MTPDLEARLREILLRTTLQVADDEEGDASERYIESALREVAALAAQEQRERDEVIMRQFVGWLSADIKELHHVLVPDLADSLDRFLVVIRATAPEIAKEK